MNEFISYQEFGRGKVIILLPSLWLSSKSYKYIAKILSKYFRVIIPDLYRGKSTYGLNAKTFDDYVICLNKFVRKLHINNFYLIGASFSGVIAAKYANKYSSEIIKLILVSTSPIPVCLRRKKIKLVNGYIQMFYHNLFSLNGIKTNILWFFDGLNCFSNHPKQCLFDALMITGDYVIESKQLPPTKMIFAKKDEFIPFKILDEMKKIRNLEIEVIDDHHSWFFLNKELFVEKVLGSIG